MSSGASSSSSPPPAEAGDGDGYWAAREEAAARLEAMLARALEEDELSAEQLETNNQLQEDEVLALQAIYGDDMVILDDKAGLRSFQIFVRYPVPDGTKVLLNSRPNRTMIGTDDNDGGQDVDADVADERAVARKLLVDATISLMQTYSEKRSQEIFLKSLHECGICLSENTGFNFTKLPCHHSFCMKCMESHCRIHMKEGTLTMLTCRSPLPSSILKSLLGDDCYTRWESFTLQKLLDTMPDLVYCPRCDAACLEVDNDAQCPECLFTFCSLCKERRHVGEQCLTPEKRISILRERHQKYSLPEKQLLKEQKEIDELLNVCEVLRNSKQCPFCKMAISKTEGCNHMTCRNCGKSFCYHCNKRVSGYNHFWSGNCELYEHNNQGRRFGLDEEPDDDEDPDDDDAWDLEPELRLCPCPSCGRRNEKFDTNNHILCIGCRGHYCALCKKRVLKSSEHYGPRGCQQHTYP